MSLRQGWALVRPPLAAALRSPKNVAQLAIVAMVVFPGFVLLPVVAGLPVWCVVAGGVCGLMAVAVVALVMAADAALESEKETHR